MTAKSTKKTGAKRPAAKKNPKSKAAPKHEPGMLVVRPGRVLLWPNYTKRGGPGTVVREDDPYIQPYRGTLTAAPKGSVVDVPEDRRWINDARDRGFNFRDGFDKKKAQADADAAKKEAEDKKAEETGLHPTDPDDLPEAEA